jgi:hypothetical protein
MRGRRHREEQIIAMLKQGSRVDDGGSLIISDLVSGR